MKKQKPDYEANRGKLSALLKDKQANTPLQEVRPVAAAPVVSPPSEPSEPDVHVNFWASADLIRRVKVYGATNGKTMKQMCAEALEAYLIQK